MITEVAGLSVVNPPRTSLHHATPQLDPIATEIDQLSNHLNELKKQVEIESYQAEDVHPYADGGHNWRSTEDNYSRQGNSYNSEPNLENRLDQRAELQEYENVKYHQINHRRVLLEKPQDDRIIRYEEGEFIQMENEEVDEAGVHLSWVKPQAEDNFQDLQYQRSGQEEVKNDMDYDTFEDIPGELVSYEREYNERYPRTNTGNEKYDHTSNEGYDQERVERHVQRSNNKYARDEDNTGSLHGTNEGYVDEPSCAAHTLMRTDLFNFPQPVLLQLSNIKPETRQENIYFFL